jgi:hypothetical protein
VNVIESVLPSASDAFKVIVVFEFSATETVPIDVKVGGVFAEMRKIGLE